MTRDELRALDQLPRPERIKRLWDAMPEQAKRKVWERLSANGRADVIAACFDAEEVPA